MSENNPDDKAVKAGARVYIPLLLPFYDFWVLWISNTYVWKCPTDEVLVPLFRSALGETHLDIGVGTGYIPAKAIVRSACQEITLLDLNPNSLSFAKARIESSDKMVKVKTLLADALEPLPLPESEKFDSISLCHLLHCLPGSPESKTRVFDYVKPHLARDGTLVGWTILGKEAPMNWFASVLMRSYNKIRVFSNWDDNLAAFEQSLKRNFEEVEVWTVGRVCVFRARKPLDSPIEARS
ncbi:unnamed protein product [Clonostachys rhizophaga]|uniref:Methyltransferase type 12 domain-containing protein n=1 Tax=Clonostachys rhizophaga TaxID=160324 RepID=A0A9N9VUB9_9HYPO|nr:unnamed protein product [Clonostachys rhizophaga]